jgi:hypothetical protein
VPSAISGANIHSETMARPAFARTAAHNPSAAVTRSRPFNVMAICARSAYLDAERTPEITVLFRDAGHRPGIEGVKA